MLNFHGCISYDYIYTVKIPQTYITHTHTHTHTYTAGFDYVPTTTELTFQPGTTSVCGSVGQVNDDVIVEGAEFFSLLLSSQNNRVLIQQNTAQVTIEDNDGRCSITPCFLQKLVIFSPPLHVCTISEWVPVV